MILSNVFKLFDFSSPRHQPHSLHMILWIKYNLALDNPSNLHFMNAHTTTHQQHQHHPLTQMGVVMAGLDLLVVCKNGE
jgi:hypothetical protein